MLKQLDYREFDMRYYLLFIILFILLPYQSTLAEELLVYLFLDIGRTEQTKKTDIKILDEIVSLVKSNQDVKYFFHFTGVARKSELFFMKSPDTNQRVDGYKKLYLGANYNNPKFSPKSLSYELSLIKANLIDLKLNKDVSKLLIFFSDMDFIDKNNNISSVGKGFGDGWLTSRYSPFYKEFLREDNSILKNSKIIILNSRVESVFIRQNRLYFYAKMFNSLECELYFLGPLYPSDLIKQYVEAILSKRLGVIVSEQAKQTELIQFFTLDGGEENISVYQ